MIPNYLEGLGEVQAYEGFELVTVRNPGERMSRAQQNALVAALVKPASEGFGHSVSSASLRRRTAGKQEYLLVPITGGDVAGFCSASKMPLEGYIYCDGIVLDPQFQRKGIGTTVLRHLVDISKCTDLAYTTQSPVMYLLLQRVAGIVYPQTSDIDIPVELQLAMLDFMENENTSFCASTFVARNLYSYCLYPEYPWSGNTDIDRLLRTMLQFDEDGGTRDGFLLAGNM